MSGFYFESWDRKNVITLRLACHFFHQVGGSPPTALPKARNTWIQPRSGIKKVWKRTKNLRRQVSSNFIIVLFLFVVNFRVVKRVWGVSVAIKISAKLASCFPANVKRFPSTGIWHVSHVSTWRERKKYFTYLYVIHEVFGKYFI